MSPFNLAAGHQNNFLLFPVPIEALKFFFLQGTGQMLNYQIFFVIGHPDLCSYR
jgi:hypothetical protein